MRSLPLLLWLALTSTTATAQLHAFSPPPEALAEPDGSSAGRHNQRMENIVLEDAGSRVEERRVGGQTQRITVVPKTSGAPLPSYEVRTNDGARNHPAEDADHKRAPRVWNLHQF